MRGRHRLTIFDIVLAGGIFLVLLGLYTTWWGPERAYPRHNVSKGPQVPTAPILRDQHPLSNFSVVARKNLFNEDRKGTDQDQAGGDNSLEGYQLRGIIIIGNTRAALIATKSPPQGQDKAPMEVVYPGDKYNGFKVEEITNESLILSGKDGHKTLTFPE